MDVDSGQRDQPCRGPGDKRGLEEAGRGLFAFVSADGIHWMKKSEAIPYRPKWRHAFDSPNVSFWSEAEKRYVAYFRTWTDPERLRTDGFISVNAGSEEGELLTRPLTLSGSKLLLNFSTSAAGSLRVEIQTAEGQPIPGFTLADAKELFGDEIDRPYSWKAAADVSSLAGKPVCLRFVMREADLYSPHVERAEANVRVLSAIEGHPKASAVGWPVDALLAVPHDRRLETAPGCSCGSRRTRPS